MSNLVIWYTFEPQDVSFNGNIMYNRAYGARASNVTIDRTWLSTTSVVLGSYSYFVNSGSGSNFPSVALPASYFPNKAITMSIWTLFPTSGNSALFQVTDLSGNSTTITANSPSTIVLTNSVSSTTVNTTRPIDSAWHHLVLTVVPGKMSFYLDGSLNVASTVPTITPPHSINTNSVFGYQYRGYIDDIRIYNTALSADQVYSLYSQNFSYCYYRFETGDVSGNQLANYATGQPVFDASFVDNQYNVFGSSTYCVSPNASSKYGTSALYYQPAGTYTVTTAASISNATVVNKYGQSTLFGNPVDIAVNSADTIMISAQATCIALSTKVNGQWTPFIPITAFSTTNTSYYACDIFPDGSKIVVAGNPLYNGQNNNGTFLATWNGTTYNSIVQTLDTSSKQMVSLGLSANAQTLVAASHYSDGHFYFATWNSGSSNFSAYTQTLDTNGAYAAVVCTCTVSPDASMLVYSYGDTVVWAAWNGSNYSATPTQISNGSTFSTNKVLFAPDGKHLFAVGQGIPGNNSVALACFYFNGTGFDANPVYAPANSFPTNSAGQSCNAITITGDSKTVYTIPNFFAGSLWGVLSYGISYNYTGTPSPDAANYLALPRLPNVDPSGIAISLWMNCTDTVAKQPLTVIRLGSSLTGTYTISYDSSAQKLICANNNILPIITFSAITTPITNVPSACNHTCVSAPGLTQIIFFAIGSTNRGLYYSRVLSGVVGARTSTTLTYTPANPPGAGDVNGCAVSGDGSRVVAVIGTYNGSSQIYWGDSSTLFAGTGSSMTMTRIDDATSRNYWTIAMTRDGNRILVASTTDGYIYMATWNGTNYGTLSTTLDIARPGQYAVAVSNDGNRIAYTGNYNLVYWATWNGTNYEAGTQIPNVVGFGTQGRSISFSYDGNVLIYGYNGTGNGIYYFYWTGNNYSPGNTAGTSGFPGNPIANGLTTDNSGTIFYCPWGSSTMYYSKINYVVPNKNNVLMTQPAPFSSATANIGSIVNPNYMRFATDCSLNSWHHVAWTITPNYWKTWIDGSGTTFFPIQMDSSGVTLSGGIVALPAWFDSNVMLWDPSVNSYTSSYSGLIDEVRIYNRPLVDGEVMKLFKSSCLLTNYYDPSGNDLMNMFYPAYTNSARNTIPYIGHSVESGNDLGMMFATYSSGDTQPTIPYYHNSGSYTNPTYTSYSANFATIEPVLPFLATGAFTTTSYNNGYYLVTFTNYGTITFGADISGIQVLIVGGGGGGGSNGSSGYTYGGGGGQGGQSLYRSFYTVQRYSTYICDVGRGGAGGTATADGDRGTASMFANIIAAGGFGGSNATASARGAGGTSSLNGAAGGAGGTINAIGVAGSGGPSYTIGVSAATNYGGGGGGGRSGTFSSGDAAGGNGGGGSGNSTTGTANTGGGGGGARGSGAFAAGGIGGSGIIAFFLGAPPLAPSNISANSTTATSTNITFTAPVKVATAYTFSAVSPNATSITGMSCATATTVTTLPTSASNSALTISEYGSPRMAFYSAPNLYYSFITNNTTWTTFAQPTITAYPANANGYVSCAIASSARRGVFVAGTNGGTNTIYWGDLSGMFVSSATSLTVQQISDVSASRYNAINVTSDGSRLVVSDYTNTRIYFSDWTGTTYGAMMTTLESRRISCQGVAITNDRSRIAYISDTNPATVLWADWNGINYNDGTPIGGYAANSGGGRMVQFVNNDPNAIIFSFNGALVQYAIWNGTTYSTSIGIPTASVPANNNWGLICDPSYVYVVGYGTAPLYRSATTYFRSPARSYYKFPSTANPTPITALSFGSVSAVVSSTPGPNYMSISAPGATRVALGSSYNVPYYFRILSGTWQARANISITGATFSVCTGVAISGDGLQGLFALGANAATMYIYWGSTSNLYSGGSAAVTVRQTMDTTARAYTCCTMTPSKTRVVACTATAIFWANFNLVKTNYLAMTQTIDTARTNITSVSITTDATVICYSTTAQTTFFFWSLWNNYNNYGVGNAISAPTGTWYGSACTFLFDSSKAILMTGNTGALTADQAAYSYWQDASFNYSPPVATTALTATGGGKLTGIACDSSGAVFFSDASLNAIYTMQCTKTGGNTYTTASPLSITGLTPGTTYSTLMSAANSTGTSSFISGPNFSTSASGENAYLSTVSIVANSGNYTTGAGYLYELTGNTSSTINNGAYIYIPNINHTTFLSQSITMYMRITPTSSYLYAIFLCGSPSALDNGWTTSLQMALNASPNLIFRAAKGGAGQFPALAGNIYTSFGSNIYDIFMVYNFTSPTTGTFTFYLYLKNNTTALVNITDTTYNPSTFASLYSYWSMGLQTAGSPPTTNTMKLFKFSVYTRVLTQTEINTIVTAA